MVRRVARHLCARLPRRVDLDDLISMGTLGLIEAIDRFDPQRGVLFRTFCLPRIRGEILDGLRRQEWTPRRVRELASGLARTGAELRARLGRPASAFEMAAELRVDLAEYQHMERRCGGASMEQNPDAVARAAGPDEFAPPKAAHWKQIRELAMRDLDGRERRLVDLHYFEGLRLKEIAPLLRITHSRVAQIHAEVIKKLRGGALGTHLCA